MARTKHNKQLEITEDILRFIQWCEDIGGLVLIEESYVRCEYTPYFSFKIKT